MAPMTTPKLVREAHDDLRSFFNRWIRARVPKDDPAPEYGPCECSTCRGTI